MSTLYEIDQKIMSCIDMETGEVIDFERLDALQMARDAKIEGVACSIKNLLSDADAIKIEKEALAEREAKCRKKADGLKWWITNALSGQKFSTAKCAVSFRRSEQVEITDESIIPQDLMTQTVTFKPDKKAIKELLKADHEVSGCRLIENQNVQIR